MGKVTCSRCGFDLTNVGSKTKKCPQCSKATDVSLQRSLYENKPAEDLDRAMAKTKKITVAYNELKKAGKVD